jgi:hypothetical protein
MLWRVLCSMVDPATRTTVITRGVIMSWTDFHRRNFAITAVLEHARRTAQTALPVDLPEVRAVFGSPQELVSALHYKWSLLVTGYMDYDMFEEDKDPEYARRHAEQRAAAQEPMLRELIEANEAPGFRNALEAPYLGMAPLADGPAIA